MHENAGHPFRAGVGWLKVDDLMRYGDPVAVSMMRAIKAAFDPNGILNPGAVLA